MFFPHGVTKRVNSIFLFHLIAKLMQQLNPELIHLWYGTCNSWYQAYKVRRFKLCQKSAIKTLNSRQHANLFRLNHNLYNTRHRSEAFTNRLNIWRYFKSPVIYLTRILNNEEESWNITDCNGYKATFALCTECD